MSTERIFVAVLIASLSGFGGQGSLPVLRSELPLPAAAGDALILEGLSVGNVSPGPNGLYLVAVGFFAAGMWGGLAATGALVIPPFLVLIVERVHVRMLRYRRSRGALHCLGLAVAALIIWAAVFLVMQACSGIDEVLITVAAAVLLMKGAPPSAIVAGALAVSLLI